MVSKNRQVWAPCGEGKTMASLIFGQFRPFQGFGILFLQCGVFPDRGGALWQKLAFLLFQSNEKRHASDSGFRIRRRQLRERRRAVRGQRVPRGREMRRVRIFLEKIRIRKSVPVCLHPGLGQSADQQGDGSRTKNRRQGLVSNGSQNECAEKSPDAKIQCFPD
jgi:hypothetical protein